MSVIQTQPVWYLSEDRYSDAYFKHWILEQGLPLATVQSGQNYNYLLRQRTNGLLKWQKNNLSDRREDQKIVLRYLPLAMFLKVKCDKFSQLPGTWSQFGAFNFQCWCASGAVCEQRSTRRVVPTSVPTCLPYSLRARSGSAGYSFQ